MRPTKSKGQSFFVFFAAAVFLILSLFPAYAAPKPKKLVLKARLFKVEAFSPETVVDALDASSAQGALPTASVSFLIKDVLRGELPLQKRQGNAGSVIGQAQDAVKEKSFLKLVTMDFENPDVEHEDRPRWFIVGVQSPLESFKILSWKDLPPEPYRLVLSKENDSAGWILESSEKSFS